MLLRTAIALLLTTACATTGDDRAPPAELVVQTQRGQDLRIATSDLAAVWTSLPLLGVHHAEAFTPAEDTYSVEKLQKDPVTVGFREYGNKGNDRDLVFMRDEQADVLAASGLVAFPTTLQVGLSWPQAARREMRELQTYTWQLDYDRFMPHAGILRTAFEAAVAKHGKPIRLTRPAYAWLRVSDLYVMKRRELVTEQGRMPISALDTPFDDMWPLQESCSMTFIRGRDDRRVEMRLHDIPEQLLKQFRWDVVQIEPIYGYWRAGEDRGSDPQIDRTVRPPPIEVQGTVGRKPVSGKLANVTYLLHGRAEVVVHRQKSGEEPYYVISNDFYGQVITADTWDVITAEGGTRVSVSALNPASRQSLLSALPSDTVAVFFADRCLVSTTRQGEEIRRVFRRGHREVVITSAPDASLYVKPAGAPGAKAP